MSQTQSLKEEQVKIGQIIKANPKQVKQGPVLRGPASLAVFSCGIRLTPLEAVTDGCSLPNIRLLASVVAEISLIQFSFVVLKGPSNCSHAIGPKGEVSGDELESSRQGSRLKGLQVADGGDLHGRPDP